MNTTFRDRYMPAFRAFYETHEHNNCTDAVDRGDAALMPLEKLGKLVSSIRHDNTAVPAELFDELFDELGFEMDPRV